MIDLLINSYKSSESYHEVQNHVAEICHQASENTKMERGEGGYMQGINEKESL